MRDHHPLAGQVVRVHITVEGCGITTGPAVVDDWWTRAGKTVWEVMAGGCVVHTRICQAVQVYAARRGAQGRDLSEEPVYVHQCGLGYLVAPEEIEGCLDGPEHGLVSIDIAALGGGSVAR